MGRSLCNTSTHSKSSALTPENAWSERWSRDSNMYLLSMVRKCETWDSFRAIRLCISNWTVAPALCRCGHVALTVRTPNGSRRKETQMSSFRASIDEDWDSDPVPMISGLSHAVYVPFRGLDFDFFFFLSSILNFKSPIFWNSVLTLSTSSMVTYRELKDAAQS